MEGGAPRGPKVSRDSTFRKAKRVYWRSPWPVVGWRLAAYLLVFLAVACNEQVAERPHLLDLAGRPWILVDKVAAPATVFLFARSDCPISNRYAPEVNRLHTRFSPHGVTFWLVYPDPAESSEAIQAHISEYGYSFGALRDPRHTLVALTRAQVTPEAAVFVPSESGPRMVYRGRIDDRFVAFGEMRAEPTVRDLEQILEAVVDRQVVTPQTTEAVGCFIADLRVTSQE